MQLVSPHTLPQLASEQLPASSASLHGVSPPRPSLSSEPWVPRTASLPCLPPGRSRPGGSLVSPRKAAGSNRVVRRRRRRRQQQMATEAAQCGNDVKVPCDRLQHPFFPTSPPPPPLSHPLLPPRLENETRCRRLLTKGNVSPLLGSLSRRQSSRCVGQRTR